MCNSWLCTLFQKIEVWLQYYVLQVYNIVIKIFFRACVCCMLVAQSCLILCDSMDCSPPGSSVCGILQARTLEWDCHALLQGIFPTQGLNPGLAHCRWTFYHLSLKGSLTYSYYKILAMFPMFYNVSLQLSFSQRIFLDFY